jgi:A/G-specific adenine glycosylase
MPSIIVYSHGRRSFGQAAPLPTAMWAPTYSPVGEKRVPYGVDPEDAFRGSSHWLEGRRSVDFVRERRKPPPREIVGTLNREHIQEALISWFEENGRDLPWRRTRDPWRVLVSEVMLQQIQVKRAVPFYERFLNRFPTVGALAEAPLSEAIRVWDDLGRYRRVVYLHRTARIVMDEHGGSIPSDPAELLKLPGVGPYTAGAVACFAYERDVAFLDTNMRRALHRFFFGLTAATPETNRELMGKAIELLPPGRGWRWNQALMETGALLCTARSPRCGECPLREGCRARAEATSSGWPKPERKSQAYRYEDTNRYYRGRVLAELREISQAGRAGIELRELGRRVMQNFDEREPRWLHAAVESLCKDGLAKVSSRSGDEVATDVVAEERAPYVVDPEKRSLEQMLSLP